MGRRGDALVARSAGWLAGLVGTVGGLMGGRVENVTLGARVLHVNAGSAVEPAGQTAL